MSRRIAKRERMNQLSFHSCGDYNVLDFKHCLKRQRWLVYVEKDRLK